MGFITLLLQPGLLVYTVPLVISLLTWLLSVLGIFHFVDADLDGDGDFDNSLFELLGLGKIPASLVITLIMFSFGWSGLAYNFTIGRFISGLTILPLVSSLIMVTMALLTSVVFTALLAKPLKNIFKDYGEASKAEDLIGKTVTLTTSTISPDFGSGVVKLDSGISVEVDIRLHKEDDTLNYGDTLLLVEFDRKKQVYFAEPVNIKDLTS